jgi:hypothetical protein
VNIIFANQPVDPRSGNLDPPGPLGPLRYFGLPMVNFKQATITTKHTLSSTT